jgi:hypothetical protein
MKETQGSSPSEVEQNRGPNSLSPDCEVSFPEVELLCSVSVPAVLPYWLNNPPAALPPPLGYSHRDREEL